MALMVAVGLLPTVSVHAQQNTRATEIINRNAARSAEVAVRDAERLQRIDDEFESQYAQRILAQVDASSQDMQATLFPIYSIFKNIHTRFNNVMTVLNDIGIPMSQAAANLPAGVTGLVAYNIEAKFDNFVNCFDQDQPKADGSVTAGTCVVYDLPANNVEVDVNGIQPLAPQPRSAANDFRTQLEVIGGPNSDAPSNTFGDGYTKYGVGSIGDSIVLNTLFGFESRYRYLRDWAVAPGGRLPATDPEWVDCGRGNSTMGTEQECEFTDPQTFEIGVQYQVDFLRDEIEVFEGSLINVRQATRAFIHDVLEALEFVEKTRDSYDPRNGNAPYDPRSRQGAQ